MRSAIVLLLVTFYSLCNAQSTRYVRAEAAGNGTGNNWDNASGDLQAMINASVSGDQIFVEVGTYKPNRRADDVNTIIESDRNNAFVLKAGVSVYGGFDPANGITDLSHHRKLPGAGANDSSILSGDLGTADNYDDNAYHVMIATEGGILDGFTIRYGNANNDLNITVNGQTVAHDRGGGIQILGPAAYVANCWLQGNRAIRGGGVYTDTIPIFENCIFSGNYVTTLNNSGGRGGGLYVQNSGDIGPGAFLVNCTFSGNKTAENGAGGAIYNATAASKITLYNAIIYGNSADGLNGIRNNGMVSASYSLIGDESELTTQTNPISGNPLFQNQISTGDNPFITGDYGLQPGSPAINAGGSQWNTSAVDIAGNSRIQFGTVDLGALESENGVKAGSIVYVKETGTGDGSSWANATNDLQAAINASTGQVWVAGGTYKPNRRAHILEDIKPNSRHNAFVLKNDIKIYGGFAGTETSLEERDLSLAENKSTLSGDFNGNDGVSGSGSSLSISGNGENAYHVVIAAGTIGTGTVLDGFIITGGNANGSSENNITVNGMQIDRWRGGGLYNYYATLTIANCVFTKNYAKYGGGVCSVYVSGEDYPTFINTVFSKNLSNYYGGGVYNSSGVSRYFNCTFWGNKANTSGGIYNNGNGVTLRNTIVYGNSSGIQGGSTRSYSLVQGESSTDNGNIPGSTNPQFVNASGGDFGLQLTSPVINKGSNSYVPEGVTTDIAGNARIQMDTVDIGAYEADSCLVEETLDIVICSGESYEFGGTVYTESIEGVTYTFPPAEGETCGTFVTLNLTVTEPKKFYVKPTASGTGDGSSWANASDDLQLVLDQALCPADSVFVASGTYIPTRKADTGVVSPGDRNNAFVLKGKGKLFGGFAGWETSLSQRVLDSGNPTILSGDFNGDDVVSGSGETLTFTGNDENVAHVVIAAGESVDAVLDGFTITGGNIPAFSDIPGITVNGESVDQQRGGGIIVLEGAQIDIFNCIIYGNGAYQGGGIHQYHSVTNITNTLFLKNMAYGIPGIHHENYGAVLYSEYSETTIVNSTLYGNKAFPEIINYHHGTIIHAPFAGTVVHIHNSVIYGNYADEQIYGAILYGITVTYSLTDVFEGEGNINGVIDPQFVDPESGDFSLQLTSPVANRGNDSLVPSGITTDIAGNPRIQDCAVDMGAYERDPLAAPVADAIQNSCAGNTIADLVAEGENLQWYDVAEDGTPLATDTALVTGSYYVSQTINDCESPRTEVAVTVYGIPSIPEADAMQNSCAGNTIADLVAEGENLQWYDIAEGGTPLALETELVSGTYYVSQTINDCESPRAEVGVTVHGLPSSPAADAQTFCIGTVADLTAEGENLQWYDVAEDGMPLATDTALVTGSYYVSQTIDDCESPRTEVIVTVYGIPSAPISDAQTFCIGTVADLTATGENLQWYDVAEGGMPLATDTELVSGTYYVSQTINDCESPRTEVVVTIYGIPSIPVADATQSFFCTGNTIADLIATGENLQWYDVAEGGTPLVLETELVSGTYYVSQTINGCESPRTEVAVSVIYGVEMPAAPSPQNFSEVTTVAALTATGDNLQWYETATGGTPLTPDVVITTGTYYVSQTIDSCESPRTEVAVTVSYPVRYVKQNASGNGDGANWDNASDDLQAMINASASGDLIFVSEGTYKPIRPADNLNTIDYDNRNNAFVLKDGVEIYGGFAGTETSLAQRDLGAGHTTILSGDFNDDDVVTTSNITGNGENAYHVIVSAGDLDDAVLDGFTVTGGYANGNSDITVNGKSITVTRGAGIFNIDASPVINNCTFSGNKATTRGGGIYVESASPTLTNSMFNKNYATGGGGIFYSSAGASTVTNCVFWGNKAGVNGGGLNIDNSAPVLINCTITGNQSSGGGGIFYNGSTKIIHNSVIYGNTANDGSGIGGNISNLTYTHSLIEGLTSTDNGNINGGIDPEFTAPESGDFSLKMTSPVINKGNNSYVLGGVDTDIAGNERIQLGTVDMGAYESSRYGVVWTTSNSWLNDVEPDEEKDVFIEGNLHVGTDYESFSANTLTVEEGGSLTIEDENSVTVYGQVTNNTTAEDFTVKSGGNLLQTEEYESDDNSGAITVERESNPILRLDYAFWSSPVRGQQIQAFSPMTLPNRIYTYETNPSNQNTSGAYEPVGNVNADFTQGKGYLFRAPNDWIPEDSPEGEAYTGKFTGEPTNGDISIAAFPNGYTSIGNPYPSNIDPDKLLGANSGISALYFWNNPRRVQTAGTDTPEDSSDDVWQYEEGSHYVNYTAMGYSNPDFNDKNISVGQGFITYTSESSVHFDNSMRDSGQSIFFKTDETERHRFWLSLSNENENEYTQILTGYMTGATNGIDSQIDGEMFGYEGSSIYSLIEDAPAGSATRFSIQGRQLPFEATDIVPLGFKAAEDGKYKISLTEFDGLFTEGNIIIYIKDKQMHHIHNLMDSPYEFESEAGEFNDRFEIVYQEEGTMGTGDQNTNTIQIYTDNDYIIIESKTEKILSVELYNLSGRSIHRNEKVNANVYKVKTHSKGILIVKAQAENGEIVTKKVINK